MSLADGTKTPFDDYTLKECLENIGHTEKSSIRSCASKKGSFLFDFIVDNTQVWIGYCSKEDTLYVFSKT